ncbi:hypothetical protein B0H34DRAFT_803004 [Crassisporium funariophilum]|nr:hypothetical protein B0H34DRAFT_803004 [Crassisporium funariophilum]
MPTTALGANVSHPTAPQDKDHSSPPPPEPNSVPKLNEPSAEGSDGDRDILASQAPVSQKCVCEPATPTRPFVKRVRSSQGAAALQDMLASLTQVGNALAAALASPTNAVDATPCRRSNAVAAVLDHKMHWLEGDKLISFIDYLQTDQTAADTYLALTQPHAPELGLQTA